MTEKERLEREAREALAGVPTQAQQLQEAAEEKRELTPEQMRESAHGTIWYCVGTGDYNVLRMTLLSQDAETLREWDAQAARLRDEIRRALIWHDSGSPNVSS